MNKFSESAVFGVVGIFSVPLRLVGQPRPIEAAVIIVDVESDPTDDPLSEVGVRDVEFGEGDRVAGLFLQFVVPTVCVEAVVGEDEAVEVGTEGATDVGHLLFGGGVEV